MFGNGKHPGAPDFNVIKEHLSSIPIANEHVEREKRDGGKVLLVRMELTYRGIKGLFSKVLKLPTEKRYQLDGVGLDLYRCVDGKNTIEDLIDYLAETHALTFFEARGLVIQHIHLLTQRGLLVVGGKAIEGDEAEAS